MVKLKNCLREKFKLDFVLQFLQNKQQLDGLKIPPIQKDYLTVGSPYLDSSGSKKVLTLSFSHSSQIFGMISNLHKQIENH